MARGREDVSDPVRRGGRESDTSGEASPTRVASPPRCVSTNRNGERCKNAYPAAVMYEWPEGVFRCGVHVTPQIAADAGQYNPAANPRADERPANPASPKRLTPIEAFRRDRYCSPEHFDVLNEYVRALEAELAEAQRYGDAERNERFRERARAEKAEAELRKLDVWVETNAPFILGSYHIWKKAEARIRELEAGR